MITRTQSVDLIEKFFPVARLLIPWLGEVRDEFLRAYFKPVVVIFVS